MKEDKRLNEVIRVKRTPGNFVMMDKSFLENPGLSWKAKGILAYLLSKPDNWKVIVRDIVNRAIDGKASVYSGLNELKAHGHYEKTPVRTKDNDRISHWEGTVSELPTESHVNVNAVSHRERTAGTSSAESLADSGVCLLTDFQEIENQEIENQDLDNRTLVRINTSNNYRTNNQSSLSEGQDGTELRDYLAVLKNNIGYSDLEQTHSADMELVDEFVAIILDVLVSKGEYINIGQENKPRQLVKGQLLKLDYAHIIHALEQFKGVSERITKKKQYILTLLYNCSLEKSAHYTNAVQADLYGGLL